MITVIKGLLAFFTSFVILSVPIKNAPLFDHMYGILEPVTEKIFIFIKDQTKKALSDGEEIVGTYLESLNATPGEDIINSKSSGITKPSLPIHSEYTAEERARLIQVLKYNR